MCATRFIDLSTPIMNGSNEPRPPEVTYLDHEEFGGRAAKNWGIPVEELHDGVGGAAEFVTVSTHSATHMDAPLALRPHRGGRTLEKNRQGAARVVLRRRRGPRPETQENGRLD